MRSRPRRAGRRDVCTAIGARRAPSASRVGLARRRTRRPRSRWRAFSASKLKRQPHGGGLGELRTAITIGSCASTPGWLGEQRAAVPVRARRRAARRRSSARRRVVGRRAAASRVAGGGRVEVVAVLAVRRRASRTGAPAENGAVANRIRSAGSVVAVGRVARDEPLVAPEHVDPRPVDRARGGRRGQRGPDLLHDRAGGQRERGPSAVALHARPASRAVRAATSAASAVGVGQDDDLRSATSAFLRPAPGRARCACAPASARLRSGLRR